MEQLMGIATDCGMRQFNLSLFWKENAERGRDAQQGIELTFIERLARPGLSVQLMRHCLKSMNIVHFKNDAICEVSRLAEEQLEDGFCTAALFERTSHKRH